MNESQYERASGERFSQIIHRVRERAESNQLTLSALLDVFGPKGHVLLTIFLVLPFLQPIPLPGISTALGLTIAFVSYLMFLGRPPYIPKRFANVPIDRTLLLRICSGLETVMSKLEKLIRPRGRSLMGQETLRRMNALILCAHAILLSLPLPIPFSNFLPAAVLFLIALSILEEDFYLLIAGYVAVLTSTAFFTALIVAPWVAVHFFHKGG